MRMPSGERFEWVKPIMLSGGVLVQSIARSYVVVSNIFYFHPYLGKIPILTNIFQMG